MHEEAANGLVIEVLADPRRNLVWVPGLGGHGTVQQDRGLRLDPAPRAGEAVKLRMTPSRMMAWKEGAIGCPTLARWAAARGNDPPGGWPDAPPCSAGWVGGRGEPPVRGWDRVGPVGVRRRADQLLCSLGWACGIVDRMFVVVGERVRAPHIAGITERMNVRSRR
jgi:hypothetical protein